MVSVVFWYIIVVKYDYQPRNMFNELHALCSAEELTRLCCGFLEFFYDCTFLVRYT